MHARNRAKLEVTMTGELKINDKDAYTEWGVSPSEGAYAALRTPPGKKERVVNESRLQHGVRYEGDVERWAERELTLPIHIVGSGQTDLNRKYDAFVRDVLEPGVLTIEHAMNPGVRYKCLYVACSSYYEDCGIAKFQLRLREPNPNDRQ